MHVFIRIAILILFFGGITSFENDTDVFNSTYDSDVTFDEGNQTVSIATESPFNSTDSNVTDIESVDSTTLSSVSNVTTSTNVTKGTPINIATTIKTEAPTIKTTLPPKTTPIAMFKSSEFCTCNLKVDVCDINCCCDTDCKDEDRKAFSECLPHRNTMQDDRYCFQTDILFINHTVYKMNRTESGLFCIQYDNNQGTHFYQNVQPIINETEFNQVYRKHVIKSAMADSSKLKIEMNDGDDILIVDTNGVVQKLSVPSTLMSSRCEYMQPLLYLRDQEISCNLDFEHSSFPFKTKVLEPRFYFHDFRVLKNQSVLNSLNLSNIHTYHEFPSNETFDSLLIAVTADCFDVNSEAAPCNSSSILDHHVKHVAYRISHNGVDGIEAVNVTIHVTDIGAQIAQPKISFKVSYHWNDEISKPFSRSGNPGYVVGKPILAGNIPLDNDVTQSNHSIRLNDNPELWMTVMSSGDDDGYCRQDNETTNRISVSFGEDLRTSCLIQLSYEDFESGECFPEDRMMSFLKGSGLPEFIGMFGNADADNLDEWIPLIKGSDKIISAAKGDSVCIVLHLKLQLAYANVGSLSNPQAKVIGAMYWFEKQEVSFNCIGTYCSFNDKKVFEVSTEVNFLDVTQSSVPQFSSPPVFRARLPKDFFYPILSHGCNLSVNSVIFMFAMLLIFMNFSLQQ